MVSTFRIVLQQDEGFDVHDTREFDLELGSKFVIGRASKNTSKGYLLPAKHNVYIDSPVVSREHAILTANTSTGTPQIYITDTKSMHGTHVNGTPLEPHTPKLLSNGDKLQFGVNVNRNETYFVAYKYTFTAELSNPEPFSRGFTVPEAESESESEELDFVQSGRGSQLNPLVLDDSDAEPEHEAHDEYAQHSEDGNDVTMAQLDEEDEESAKIINMSEDEDAADSLADDIAESDFEGDAASTDSAPEYSPESPLAHEAQYAEEVEEQEHILATRQFQATTVEQGQLSATPSAPLALSEPEQVPVDTFFADFGYPAISNLPPPRQEMDDYLAFGTDPFNNTRAPPLPPRPAQKRQRIWDETPQDEQEWFVGMPSTAPSFASSAVNEYTHLSQTLPVSPVERIPAFLPAADRIQTPPPTMPLDAVSPTSLPSTRRTGVSITEIVDAHPPTPTSINSRKRSADDAFDKKIEEPEAEGVVASHSVSDVAAPEEVVAPTVEEVTPQSQRPIAQPRSIFRRALRAAKVMVPATALGAVFTVTALTTLPESFFTVA